MRKRNLASTFCLIGVLALPGVTSAQPDPAPAAAIPLTEINGRAEDLQRQLSGVGRQLPGKASLASQSDALVKDYQTVQSRVSDTDDLLESNPTLLDVRGEERYWRSYRRPIGPRNMIVDAVDGANRAVSALEQLELTWNATLREIMSLSGVSAVTDTVHQSLSAIQRLKSNALEQRGMALTLQNQSTRLDLMAQEELDKVQRAIDQFQERLFSRDGYPLWEFTLRREHEAARDRTMQRSLAKTKDFIQQERQVLIGFMVAYLFAIGVVLRLRTIFKRSLSTNASVIRALWLTRRPLSFAFFTILPFSIPLFHRAPFVFGTCVMLVVLVPLSLMGMQIWQHRLRFSLWILCALFFATGLLELLGLPSQLKRNLSVALNVLWAAAFMSLAWRRTASGRSTGKAQKMLTYALYCIGMGFILAALTNVFGYLTLSQVLRQTTLMSVFVGLLIFIAAYSYTSIASSLIHATRIGRLSVVQEHGPAIETWLSRSIAGIGLWFWLATTLDMLSIRNEATTLLTRVMTARIPLHSISFSLGDLLIFVAVGVIGYIFATGIRLTLREDVLPHFKLDRGIPDLISASIYYVLLLLVFLTAVSAAGVNLDKFTLLTGALGVGLGFGLQNVVNNFASGLILQFERPINIGDSLDVGTMSGTVSRIGVRSSTIVSSQGAEVIIPNAILVSGPVTNWTLHSTYRRVAIPVRVAYGADPQRVNDLLLEVVARNANVMKDPPPEASFKCFGESALEFELSFWTAHRTHGAVRSEIGIAIHDALRDAAINIPLPQREVHLHRIRVESSSPGLVGRSTAAAAVSDHPDGKDPHSDRGF